jgi:hypothetical protein
MAKERSPRRVVGTKIVNLDQKDCVMVKDYRSGKRSQVTKQDVASALNQAWSKVISYRHGLK